MALESGTYISDLVPTNPNGTDSVGQGDDHIRLIKDTVTNTFPNVTGEVTATHTELNAVSGYTGSAADLNAVVTAGIVQMYAGSSAPSGWLFCNGQAVSRTTYADLFSAIGTTFGNGNGSTTFNLPDLRDRSPLGTGTMGTSDASRVDNYSTGLGDSGGEDQHTLTAAENGPHSHGNGSLSTDSDGAHSHSRLRVNGSDPIGLDGGSPNIDNIYELTTLNESASGARYFGTNSAGSHSHNISGSTASAGSGSGHNTMHPFLAINFIIKT